MTNPAHVRLFAVVLVLSLVGWLVAAVKYRNRPAKEHMRVFFILAGFNAFLFVALLGFERAWWSFRGAFAISAAFYLAGSLGRMPTRVNYRMDEYNLQVATAWLYVGSAAVCALLALAWR